MENFVRRDNDEFVLGKNGNQSIRFAMIKSGIKKEDIAKENESLKSVFDLLDTDGNGELDRTEIQNLKTIFNSADENQDGTISEKEARHIEGKDGKKIGNKNGKLLLELVGKIMQQAVDSGIKNVAADGDDEVVTYEDGTVEVNHKDGSKTVSYEKDGNKIEQELDKDGKVRKETKTNNADGKTTVTEYDENGNKTKQKITTNDNVEYDITYKDNQPARMTKTDKNNDRVYEYVYDKTTNKFVLQKSVDNGTGATTVYEGNKATVTTKEDNKTTTEVYDGETLKSLTIEEILDEGTKVTRTVYDGEDEETIITLNDKKQQVIKNGNVINYDQDGYITGVIVQNGETVNSLAKKFGCTPQDIIKANSTCIKRQNGYYYFLVGQEIRIPDMDADDFIEINSTRKSADETIQDYSAEQQRIEEERLEAEKLEEERIQTETKTVKKYDTEQIQKEANDVAETIYNQIKGASRNKNTIAKLQQITAENAAFVVKAYKNNYGVSLAKDIDDEWGLDIDTVKEHVCSKLYEQAKKLGLSVSSYDGFTTIESLETWIDTVSASIINAMEEATVTTTTEGADTKNKVKENRKQEYNSKELAKQFYAIADKYHNDRSVNMMSEFISNNINKDNIVDFLDAYNDPEVRKGDSSIIDTVVSEIGASMSKREDVLMQILNLLVDAAKDAGVSSDTVDALVKEFTESMNYEFHGKIAKVNPSVMENVINSLIGQIKAAKSSAEAISDEEAIGSVAGSYQQQVSEAQETDDSRKDNWIGKLADSVLGWFGCTTIEEMDAKLGEYANDAKRLAELAEKVQNGEDGAVEAFKAAYKEIFGVDFNPKVIAAREEMENQIALVESYELIKPSIENALNAETKEELLQMLGDLKEQLEDSIDFEAATLEDCKALLEGVLESIQTQEDEILAEYGSLDKMKVSLEEIDQAAYGSQNPLKDAVKFNQNQQTTQMVAEIVGEVALTVALSAIPGIGEAQMAKLAASAAKWGAKGVKLAKYATKAGKAFAAVSNLQKGGKFAEAATKLGKIGKTAVKAGVAGASAAAATAFMDTTYGKEAKEILERSLSMAVFAAGGVVAADLAPVIVNAFKVGGKFATELAEDFLNMAVATGVTYIENGTITDKDAFINALMIFAMGRLGHAKTEVKAAEKTHSEGSRVPESRQLGAEEEKVLLEASNETPHTHENGNTNGNEAPHAEGNNGSSTSEGASAAEGVNSNGAKKSNLWERAKARHQERVKAREQRRADRKAAREAEAKQKAEAKAKAEAKQKAEAEAKAKAEAEAEAERLKNEAYAKFNKNQKSVELNGECTLNQNTQYALNMDNLPELTLVDGTVLNFKEGELYNRIMNMQEGEIFTIGRAGETFGNNFAKTVSGHHILVTKQNGRIIIKDISRNGRTQAKTKINSQNNNNNYHEPRTLAEKKADLINTFNKYLDTPLSQNATDDEINAAYKKLALKYHPDRYVGKPENEVKQAEEIFKIIGDKKDVYEKAK